MANRKHKKYPNQLGIIIPVLLILIYFIFIRDKEFGIESNIDACERYKNKEIRGVLISIGTGSEGGRLLSTGMSFIRRCTNGIGLNIGDSIYKPAGTYSYYIYRNCNPDSVIYIECNYKCEYLIMYSERVPDIQYKINPESISLQWSFSSKIEKYLKKIVLIKKIPLNFDLNDTINLTLNARSYIDSNINGQNKIIYKLMFYYVNDDIGDGNMTMVTLKDE